MDNFTIAPLPTTTIAAAEKSCPMEVFRKNLWLIAQCRNREIWAELFKSKAVGSGIFFSEGCVCLYISQTTQQPSLVRAPFLISLAKHLLVLYLTPASECLDNMPYTNVGEVAGRARRLSCTLIMATCWEQECDPWAKHYTRERCTYRCFMTDLHQKSLKNKKLCMSQHLLLVLMRRYSFAPHIQWISFIPGSK